MTDAGMTTAGHLVEQLQLAPHPEGGWYRETWRGPESNGRAVGTAILFLLESHQNSHWHRVDAHELWIWQMGDPLILESATTDAGPISQVTLGSQTDEGQVLQSIVEKDNWQAARPIEGNALSGSGFTLVTCVVTPGFEFAGFELAQPGWSPGRGRA